MTEGLSNLTDEGVIALAKSQGRVIVTFDLDFGEIYHFREKGQIGVIILRIEDQTVESVNRALERFFSTQASTISLERSLVIIDDRKIRISQPGP